VEIDPIQFLIDYVEKFLNWLRTSCAVWITTVGKGIYRKLSLSSSILYYYYIKSYL